MVGSRLVDRVKYRRMTTVLRHLRAAGFRGGLVLLLLSCVGCSTSRMAADRIVTAPNLHGDPAGNRQMLGLWQAMETNLLAGRIETPLVYASIPVGPPAAELKVLQLPAQEYHMSVSSRVSTNRQGKNFLALNIETNAAVNFTPRPHPATLVLLHGYMLSKETMLPWALQLAQAGYRVVLVDLRGHGQSTGAQVGFGKYEVNDLRQMLDWLQARGECDEAIGVMGFSYGATLALHWAAQDQRIRTVIAVAPYNQPAEAFERLAQALKLPLSHRAAQKAATLAADHLELKWTDWAGEVATQQLRVPALLIGGGKDSISRPEDLARMRSVAAGRVKGYEVAAADHFSLPMLLHELSALVNAWFRVKLADPAAN